MMVNYASLQNEPTALYLNFPFCKHPCTYCHYIKNLSFGHCSIPDEYISTIIIQLKHVLGCFMGKCLESIYLGGGTPSLLTDYQIEKIHDVFKQYHITSKEVSIEIHPGMCNFDYLDNNFFTRYSLGVQSFDKKTIDSYCRNSYTIDSVTNIVEQVRKGNSLKVINIDLIFDLVLQKNDFDCINQLNPETVTLYPNTRGRGIQRFSAVNATLAFAKQHLPEYNQLGKSKFIFIKNGCSPSEYSKNEYEFNGNIIGIGHNSISYIRDKTYLCQYKNNTYQFVERTNWGSRYLNSLLMGISTGVLVSSVQMCMPEIIKSHFLRTVRFGKDISEKHTQLKDSELVYLPEDEYIRFYEYVLSSYGESYAKTFLRAVGFGDDNYNVIEYYFNRKIMLENAEFESLRSKIPGNPLHLEKIKLPQLKILVEGIDGSGKDTFVDLFVHELRKRFLYDSNCRISVMGQPDSSLADGTEAKKFVEDIRYTGDANHVQHVLSNNRLASEQRIISNQGITILIRGLVTDKATFEFVFGTNQNLGEGHVISKWDKYIVVTVDPKIADTRIEHRAIPRTWREHTDRLEYFDNYYKQYSSPVFNEKIIVENTDLDKLKKIAQEMADDIYAKQFN